MGNIPIGAAALIARMNGVGRASQIRDKIVAMIHLNQTICARGIDPEGKIEKVEQRLGIQPAPQSFIKKPSPE